MGIARIAILVVAALAAGVAALLVRNIASSDGAATANSPANIVQMPTTEVLTAATGLDRGDRIDRGSLRWQPWPEESLATEYVTRERSPNALEDANEATVRVSLSAGEPITSGKIVAAGDTGFMAAVLRTGMRAVSTKITAETGAGGFILPNDHVDVILTESGGSGSSRMSSARTVLENIRVLAIDQTFQETDDDQKVVVGKTALLELTPSQSELLAMSKASGNLSLALRSLSDSGPDAVANSGPKLSTGSVRVFRYGAESNIPVRSAR